MVTKKELIKILKGLTKDQLIGKVIELSFRPTDFWGRCLHKWKFIRTESGNYKSYDICECEHCGERRRFRVW